MAMAPIPTTPTVAIARELRRLGLKQGTSGDFTVTGHYRNAERLFTYVTVLSKAAERLLAEHADAIERRTATGPFPFMVSVRYVGDIPFIDIHNGTAARVRELPAPAPAVEQPAEAAEQTTEAPAATEATDTPTPATDAPQAPACPPGLYLVNLPSTRLHDWFGVECGRCHPGIRTSLPGEWDDRADAVLAAQAHYEHTHRPADDVLTLAELEELERWPLSAAQRDVLYYAKHGQLQEFEDGFWALDVNPCKFDVNKKVARARVTAMWTAGLLNVRADGPGARLFTPSDTGRRVHALLWRAERQGLRTQDAPKDAALTPEPGRPISYPTLAEGRYFKGEQRLEAAQAPAAEQAPTERARAAEEAPAAPAAAPQPAAATPAAPAQKWRCDWRWQEAAKKLGWSTKHAAAVRAAVDGHLVRDADGTPRLVARPGLSGTPIAAGRLLSLEAAGYLVHGETDETGRCPILATDDAHRALKLWDHFQPTPVERPRKKEHLSLPPMMYGQEWTRRAEQFRAEEAERAVERERFYAELDTKRAAEELEDRCWDAWACVQGITHRLGRNVPAGWAPTDEEMQRHRLDPEIVALLRQRAAEHAAAQAPAEADTAAAVEEPQQAAQAAGQGELWDGQPGPVAGPGVVQPGMHVEYLPPFRPGARTRHCHGGTIVSIGTANVRWRPYKWHQDVRTPLEHMRIDPTMHVNQREWVRRMAAELNAGRRLPRHPEWCVWSLAQHLAYADEQAAAAAVETAVEEAQAAAPERVVVIPCGGAKLQQAAPARELYVGGYHRACRRAADALTAQGGTVVVLSALHGLVPLDQVLEPYELRMGQPGSVTPARLAEQARAMGLDGAREVVALGGAAYTTAARTVWPHASTPLAGLGGMGYQLQALAAIAAGTDRASHLPERDTPAVIQLVLPNFSWVGFVVSGRAQCPTGKDSHANHALPGHRHPAGCERRNAAPQGHRHLRRRRARVPGGMGGQPWPRRRRSLASRPPCLRAPTHRGPPLPLPYPPRLACLNRAGIPCLPVTSPSPPVPSPASTRSPPRRSASRGRMGGSSGVAAWATRPSRRSRNCARATGSTGRTEPWTSSATPTVSDLRRALAGLGSRLDRTTRPGIPEVPGRCCVRMC